MLEAICDVQTDGQAQTLLHCIQEVCISKAEQEFKLFKRLKAGKKAKNRSKSKTARKARKKNR